MRGERLGEALLVLLSDKDDVTESVTIELCDALGDSGAVRERVEESEASADLVGELEAHGVAVEQSDA